MSNYDITVVLGRGALHFLKLQLTVQVLHKVWNGYLQIQRSEVQS